MSFVGFFFVGVRIVVVLFRGTFRMGVFCVGLIGSCIGIWGVYVKSPVHCVDGADAAWGIYLFRNNWSNHLFFLATLYAERLHARNSLREQYLEASIAQFS